MTAPIPIPVEIPVRHGDCGPLSPLLQVWSVLRNAGLVLRSCWEHRELLLNRELVPPSLPSLLRSLHLSRHLLLREVRSVSSD